jgi:capsular exopolysaccharide synthesis family protein
MPQVDYETEIEVLLSPSVLEPVMADLAKQYTDIEEEYFDRLNIQQLRNTKILEVTYKDEDPQKVKAILDRLSTTYLNRSLAERKGDIKEGIKFVESQLPRLQKRVDSLQTQLQEFRQKYNLIDPDTQSIELTKQLLDIEKNYFQSEVDLKQALSAYNILQKQLNLSPEQAIAVSYLTESPRYQDLLKQLQDVEIELAQESATYTDESPQILTIKEKRDNILNLLRKETQTLLAGNFGKVSDQESVALSAPSKIRSDLTKEFVFKANEIKVLETRTNGLSKVLNDLNTRMKQMPLIARKYTDLQREIKVSAESLTRFLEAREKLQLEEAQQSLNWQVIAAPKAPESPIYPRPLRNVALGFIGGIILGLGAAFLAEKLDGSVHSVEEMKELVKHPILGYIPVQKNLNSMEEVLKKALPQFKTKTKNRPSWLNKTSPNKGYTSSYWLEAFRNLYTNVRLLGSNNNVNSLVISSASSGDGKSTISINLAQAAAAMGQKVLLIDCDLRLPQVHKRLGLTENQGLSNILATGLDLDEAIQPLPQWENLSVLPAGDTPPDPSRLLHSQKMKQLVDQLNQDGKYDLIIYDTPPVLGFADAKIIAPYTDGMILVVKMGKTERSSFKNVIEQLKVSQVPILGLVANAVNRNDEGSYYHYGNYNKYYSNSNNHEELPIPELNITKNNYD